MKRLLLATLVPLALSGCGGGGDGEVASELLALNGANYVVAGQEVVSTIAYLTDSGDLLTGVTGGGAAALAVRRVALGNRIAPRATQTLSETCDNGGTFTVQVTDVNGNGQPDAGDSVRISMTNCLLEGTTMSGAMTMTFRSLTGTFGVAPYSANATIVLERFAVSDALGSSSGDGQMDVALSSPNATTGSVTITVPNLTVVSTFGASSSTRKLTSFSLQTTVQASATGTSTSASVGGRLASTALQSQAVDVTTVRPFVQPGSAPYPTTGEALLRGAGGSSVRLGAQGQATLLFELDADGNGSYEASTTRPWSELI